MSKWAEFTGPRKRITLALIVGAVVSAVLLWVALRKVSYHQMAEAFSRADWWWFPVAFAALVCSIGVRAERWRLLFDDPHKVSWRLGFAATNIGILFNNLLPQRAGELTRVVAVKRASGVSRVETLGTIVAERMLDVFVLGVIGLAFWPFFPSTNWVFAVEMVCIAATAGPMLVVALLSGFRAHLPGVVQRLLHKLPRVGHERSHEFTASLAAGTRVLLKPHRLFPLIMLSFLCWGLAGFANWFVLLMFDFHVDAVPAMALVLVSVTFAVAIPVGPGAVGVFEAAAQASLVAFGLNASDALSYAVVAHVLVFFPFVALGLLGIWTVGRMSKARQLADPLQAGAGTNSDVLGRRKHSEPHIDEEYASGFVEGRPDERVQWFLDHYECAARETIEFLRDGGTTLEGLTVADVGCGEGITDLGIVRRARPARLVGFDINPVSKHHLSQEAGEAGVDVAFPNELEFQVSDPDRLPAADASFDVLISWSAFEHVNDPPALLREMHRIIKPNGTLFLQLWPFYYSQHGSHLMQWFPEGFCQLTRSDGEIVERLGDDVDCDRAWAEMKTDAYLTLNRVTLDELQSDMREAGFSVKRLELLSHTVQLPNGADEWPLSALGIGGVKLLATPCEPRPRQLEPTGRDTKSGAIG